MDGRQGYGTGCKPLAPGIRILDPAEIIPPAPRALRQIMTVPPRSNWNYPNPIRFGAGRISELAEACRAVGLKAPLVVTDPFLATQPMTKAALEQLKSAGLKA